MRAENLENQTLEHRAKQLQIIFETSQAGMILVNPKGVITFANERMALMFGCPLDELVGSTYPEHVHPDQRALGDERMRKLIGGEIDHVLTERHYIRKDGSDFWGYLSGRRHENPDGSLISLVGIITDITELRAVQDSLRDRKNALRQSEERYRTLVETTGTGFVVIDSHGRVLDSNAEYLRLTGRRNPSEILGRSVVEWTAPYEKQKNAEAVARCVRDKGIRNLEIDYLLPDGRIMPIEINASVQGEGASLQIITLCRDITERKKAEEKLRLSELRLRSLFENMTEGVALHEYVLDESGQPVNYRIVDVNPRYCAILGIRREEVVGKLATDAYGTSDPPYLQEFSEPFRSGKGSHLETFFPPMEKYFDISVAPWGERGFATIFLDVTEQRQAAADQKRLQDQLAQAQKMESVGRLAGGVAHDFNNMLGVIIGHADMALGGIGPENPLHSNLVEIEKAANRSADLTRQLLAFARKQTVTPKIIDLNDTVENALTMLKRLIGENIELDWRPGKNLSPVNIDPSQVDQILANLCVNARDAIVDTGKITIETGNAAFDVDYCTHHAEYIPGAYVMLAVSDNGRGMDRQTLSHVFEPFYTTKEIGKGTGLGLATVYGAVKQNKGFIIVDSEPGSGTSFKIFLPRHADKTESRTEETQGKTKTRGNETILLVEDEPAVIGMTKEMLEQMGYTVLAASKPGEALRMAQEHRGKIDLLITDVVMPEMNGRDLADKVLSLFPEIKRLFMSGYTSDVITHQGVLDIGVNFIQKPFTMKELGMMLREALEKH